MLYDIFQVTIMNQDIISRSIINILNSLDDGVVLLSATSRHITIHFLFLRAANLIRNIGRLLTAWLVNKDEPIVNSQSLYPAARFIICQHIVHVCNIMMKYSAHTTCEILEVVYPPNGGALHPSQFISQIDMNNLSNYSIRAL